MPAGAECVTLNDGHKIPVLGLGTWRAASGEEVEGAVYAALEAGYRHIDCAAIYMNERDVGRAIKRFMDKTKTKREDLFVTTKLWNTCHEPDKVEASIKNSLSLMGLSYVDMYLIHFPVSFEYNGVVGQNGNPDSLMKKDSKGMPIFSKTAPQYKTWAAMEEILKKGYTKSIGVSNYTMPMILDMLNYAKVMPAVNQIEVHPYLQRNDLIALCTSLGIKITAYSPLGAGAVDLLKNPVLEKIAKQHKVSTAQVAIKWSLQRGNIVIPKSVKEKNIKDNFAMDFKLTENDMKEISTLDTNKTALDTTSYWGFNFNAY